SASVPASSEGARRLECPPYLTGDVDGAGDEHSPLRTGLLAGHLQGRPRVPAGLHRHLDDLGDACGDLGRGQGAFTGRSGGDDGVYALGYVADHRLQVLVAHHTHYEDEAGRGELLGERAVQRREAPGAVRPIEHHKRLAGDYLHAAGSGEAGDRLPDRLLVEPPPQQCFHRRHGNGGVVRLVTAVHRQQQVGVVGLGAVDVHVPAANGGPGVDGEVPSVGTVFDAEVAGGGGGDLDDGLGEVPGDEDRPGPGDGELLDGDLLDRRAQVLGVLEVDPGEDGHVGVDDVGGVQATAQAHLDHRRVDRLIGEEGEGR